MCIYVRKYVHIHMCVCVSVFLCRVCVHAEKCLLGVHLQLLTMVFLQTISDADRMKYEAEFFDGDTDFDGRIGGIVSWRFPLSLAALCGMNERMFQRGQWQ